MVLLVFPACTIKVIDLSVCVFSATAERVRN